MKRPLHIDPQRWARLSWPAKEQARREYRAARRVRPDEPTLETHEPTGPIPRAWADRIPLVEEMLALGRAPEEIVAAFGITLNAVQKGLNRAGRGDLARPFWRTLEAQRRHPCADCPTLVHRESTRCRPCASAKPRSGRGEVAA